MYKSSGVCLDDVEKSPQNSRRVLRVTQHYYEANTQNKNCRFYPGVRGRGAEDTSRVRVRMRVGVRIS